VHVEERDVRVERVERRQVDVLLERRVVGVDVAVVV